MRMNGEGYSEPGDRVHHGQPPTLGVKAGLLGLDLVQVPALQAESVFPGHMEVHGSGCRARDREWPQGLTEHLLVAGDLVSVT